MGEPASPRSGSAYVLLRPEAVARTTFCWPDNVYDPLAIGRAERLPELCARGRRPDHPACLGGQRDVAGELELGGGAVAAVARPSGEGR